MFAEIVVNRKSKAVDRIFDYEIPQDLEDKIKVGSRVIVPFSRNNSESEGYVLKVKPVCNLSRGIKKIIGIVSEEPAFKPDMVDIILYMHKRYLASYIDIIRTIIPTGTIVKSVEWVSVVSVEGYSSKSKIDALILERLSANGGGMDTYSLKSYFENDISQRLNHLEKNNVIKREFIHTQNIKKKIIRCVRLSADADEIEEYCSKTRSNIQKRMLQILSDAEYLSTADIVRFSIGNYGALSALAKKGIVEFFDITAERNIYDVQQITKEMKPTEEQQVAIDTINSAVESKSSEVFLLHGVTGSGKTEVFLQSIKRCIELGRTALVLVPEISLTPQMVSRFVSRFGTRVAILHSSLSLGERYDQWSRIMNGDADIVIGARSAVFAPLSNIGIIIIDEEHSETYKSEMTPRYHAREIAQMRAEQFNAVTVLASATPSVESYKSALDGKYKLITMNKRYNAGAMPEVMVVDMRKELESGNKSMFSKRLYNAIGENLENGEQTILLMNRRGFSNFVSCRKCGFVPMCPNCNISLTYHKYDNSLKCHYCGHTQENYRVCPLCGSEYIRYFGGGTQKVEDEVRKLFPMASTIRLDADVTTKKNSHKNILDKFSEEKIDILIGTQMVSKGLDFSNVTLVGVMSADTMLHINDFRSGERTFDLLEQVAGRAGRGDKPGRAIIQTYNPDNFAIDLVKTHNYIDFYNKTVSERRAMWYPPFSEMICVRFTADDNETTRKAAFQFKYELGDINKIPYKIAILGPIPSGVSKVKNKYRWQILFKCENADLINDRLEVSYNNTVKMFDNVQIVIDKNPINIY